MTVQFFMDILAGRKMDHLHPLAVAQTSSRPPWCTATARSVSADSSPTVTLACKTTSNKQAPISPARDKTGLAGCTGTSTHQGLRLRRVQMPCRRTRGGRRAAGTRPWRRIRAPRGGGRRRSRSARRRIHAAQFTFPTAVSTSKGVEDDRANPFRRSQVALGRRDLAAGPLVWRRRQ